MPADPGRERRLNPLALPAETDARFTLLVIAAVLLVVWASLMLTSYLGGLFSLQLDFLNTDYPSLDDLPPGLPLNEALLEQQARLLLYLGRELARLALPLGLLLALFCVATLWYRTHPRRIRRRYPSKPIDPDRHPEFNSQVREIIGRAHLGAQPDVEVGESLTLADGQAYGFEPSYTIRLDGGLRRLMRGARHVVESVILHELGHIVNGDVGRYYFALAIWLATVIVLFTPAMLALAVGLVRGVLGGGRWGITLLLILQVAAEIGLVWAVLAGLLRLREKYADWRAAAWGAEQHLRRILQGRSESETLTPWKRLWRRHPSPQERLRAISDPAGFFDLSWDLPLSVGAVTALLLGGLVVLSFQAASIGSALGGIGSISVALADLPGAFRLGASSLDLARVGVFLALLLPLSLIATLLAGTLALQAQRQAIADTLQKRSGLRPYLRLAWAALLFAGGLEIGYAITPPPILSPLAYALQSSDFQLTRYLLLLGGTSLSAWLALGFTRFSAARVLGTHWGPSPPTFKRRVLTGSFVVVFWGLFLPIQVERMAMFGQSPGIEALLAEIAQVGWLISSGLLLATCAASWVHARRLRSGDRTPCPACALSLDWPVHLAARCEQCGSTIAKWLFA